MPLAITYVCAFWIIGVFILGGCQQETSKNAYTAQAKPALQTHEQKNLAHNDEELFNQYCSPCHPDGGNVSNPQRTLRGSSLRKNNITNREAIVNIMRHPISRMIRFDETALSDKDAMEIADYILKNFQ